MIKFIMLNNTLITIIFLFLYYIFINCGKAERNKKIELMKNQFNKKDL